MLRLAILGLTRILQCQSPHIQENRLFEDLQIQPVKRRNRSCHWNHTAVVCVSCWHVSACFPAPSTTLGHGAAGCQRADFVTSAKTVREYMPISFLIRFLFCLSEGGERNLFNSNFILSKKKKKTQQCALTDIFIALLYVINLKFQAWSDRNHWSFIQSWTTASLEVWIGDYCDAGRWKLQDRVDKGSFWLFRKVNKQAFMRERHFTFGLMHVSVTRDS